MDKEDDICPITHEPFRDPIRASDGRLYEREAITKWVSEHGTSPFTREPLHWDDLRPASRSTKQISRRPHSSVSFSARRNAVTLPPLRSVRRSSPRPSIDIPLASIHSSAPNTPVPAEVHDVVVGSEHYCDNESSRKVWCLLVSGIIISGIIAGIVLGVR